MNVIGKIIGNIDLNLDESKGDEAIAFIEKVENFLAVFKDSIKITPELSDHVTCYFDEVDHAFELSGMWIEGKSGLTMRAKFYESKKGISVDTRLLNDDIIEKAVKQLYNGTNVANALVIIKDTAEGYSRDLKLFNSMDPMLGR